MLCQLFLVAGWGFLPRSLMRSKKICKTQFCGKNKFDGYLFGGIWTILNIVLFHTNPLYPFLFLKIPLVHSLGLISYITLRMLDHIQPAGWRIETDQLPFNLVGCEWGGDLKLVKYCFFPFLVHHYNFPEHFSMELSLVLRSPGWLKYYNLDRNDAYIYIVMICIYMHTCITSATTRRLIIDG